MLQNFFIVPHDSSLLAELVAVSLFQVVLVCLSAVAIWTLGLWMRYRDNCQGASLKKETPKRWLTYGRAGDILDLCVLLPLNFLTMAGQGWSSGYADRGLNVLTLVSLVGLYLSLRTRVFPSNFFGALGGILSHSINVAVIHTSNPGSEGVWLGLSLEPFDVSVTIMELFLVVLIGVNLISARFENFSRKLFVTTSRWNRVNEAISLENEREVTLLSNVFPSSLIPTLKAEGRYVMPSCQAVALINDIAGFTAWCSKTDTQSVFRVLNRVYASFDQIAELYSVTKVKTIGDAWFGVCWDQEEECTEEGEGYDIADHAERVVCCAIQMSQRFEELVAKYLPDSSLALRTGVSCAEATVFVIGILGNQSVTFDVVGEAVDRANRLEASCTPGEVFVCQTVRDLVSSERMTFEEILDDEQQLEEEEEEEEQNKEISFRVVESLITPRVRRKKNNKNKNTNENQNQNTTVLPRGLSFSGDETGKGELGRSRELPLSLRVKKWFRKYCEMFGTILFKQQWCCCSSSSSSDMSRESGKIQKGQCGVCSDCYSAQVPFVRVGFFVVALLTLFYTIVHLLFSIPFWVTEYHLPLLGLGVLVVILSVFGIFVAKIQSISVPLQWLVLFLQQAWSLVIVADVAFFGSPLDPSSVQLLAGMCIMAPFSVTAFPSVPLLVKSALPIWELVVNFSMPFLWEGAPQSLFDGLLLAYVVVHLDALVGLVFIHINGLRYHNKREQLRQEFGRLGAETELNERLLESALPNTITSRLLLSDGQDRAFENFESGGALFCSIEGLTNSSNDSLVLTLEIIFGQFDSYVKCSPSLTRVKTTGTKYLIVSGIDEGVLDEDDNSSIPSLASASLTLTRIVEGLRRDGEIPDSAYVKTGIAIGGFVGGLCGRTRFVSFSFAPYPLR